MARLIRTVGKPVSSSGGEVPVSDPTPSPFSRAALAMGLCLVPPWVFAVATYLSISLPLAATFGVVVIGLLLVWRQPFGWPRAAWALLAIPLHACLVAGWDLDLSKPIVQSFWRCGYGWHDGDFLPVAALTGLVSASMLLVVTRRFPDAPRVLVRRGAVLVVVATLLLSPALAFRAARFPSPSEYVDSVPVVATLAPPSPCDDFVCTSEDSVEGQIVRRDCVGGTCRVSLGDAIVDPWRLSRPLEAIPVDHALQIRHDVAHGLWLVVDLARPSSVVAFGAHGPVDVRPHTVAASIAPPRVVVGLGGLGAVLAALGIGVWSVQRRRARRLLAAPEGVVDGAGWLVHAGDLGPVRVEPSVPAGPVVMLGVSPGEPYRGAGGATVVPTTHAEVRARFADFEARLAATLLVVLSGLLVPVAAAAASGLVL